MDIYVVKRGDTVDSIASRFGIPADSLIYNNQLSPPYALAVGQAPKTFDTQPGILYEGMDYARLGEAADSVLLMTYEWGYT